MKVADEDIIEGLKKSKVDSFVNLRELKRSIIKKKTPKQGKIISHAGVGGLY